jgi:hypothetical protein
MFQKQFKVFQIFSFKDRARKIRKIVIADEVLTLRDAVGKQE